MSETPIDPQEDPPIKPGQPSEPPQESPPGSPRPEVPPPQRDPGEPPRPDELPGNRPDELPVRGPQGPPAPSPTGEGIADRPGRARSESGHGGYAAGDNVKGRLETMA
jgi:hypothetical protein